MMHYECDRTNTSAQASPVTLIFGLDGMTDVSAHTDRSAIILRNILYLAGSRGFAEPR